MQYIYNKQTETIARVKGPAGANTFFQDIFKMSPLNIVDLFKGGVCTDKASCVPIACGCGHRAEGRASGRDRQTLK